jgi:hypothetical protein
MDPKLAILFVLISAIIGLSQVSAATFARLWRPFAYKQWRQFVPVRRRS